MSRHYEMLINVHNPKKEKLEAIREAIYSEWVITEESEDPDNKFLFQGESNLVGGDTEEEFADRVAQAIWTANEGFCYVKVEALCLEYLPFEFHIREETDYEKWKEESE